MTNFERPNSPRSIGLVFSGGGGKGAYEIGVWKALDHFGITPNIGGVSGASVGALNAALFAQGDLATAEAVWRSISPEAVMTLNGPISGLQRFLDLFDKDLDKWLQEYLSNRGILSKDGLSRLIQEYIQAELMRTFCGPVYVAAYNLTRKQLEYFDLLETRSLDELEYQLLASASIPMIFGETYLNDDIYLDGGIPVVGDNTPVLPLYQHGFRRLIVVHLSREAPVDRMRFPGCDIIEITPIDDLGDLFNGTMNFNQQKVQLLIERGFSMYAYHELKKQLESVEEFRFIFTSPTFVADQTPKQKREFYIPSPSRESSLYGTEFEIKCNLKAYRFADSAY